MKCSINNIAMSLSEMKPSRRQVLSQQQYAFFILVSVLFLFAFGALHGATIYVPDDHLTIQEAINASADDDLIIVKPGTYIENINFGGRRITLRSEQGPRLTIIDGNYNGSVVTFNQGEGPNSMLDGFKITYGNNSVDGGGIHCVNTSPTITNNIISSNIGHKGGGISVYRGDPIIRNNVISDNLAYTGGGIRVEDSSCHVHNNLFYLNVANAHGGGIYVNFNASTSDVSLFASNTIAYNIAGAYGGGIFLHLDCESQVKDSILWGNDALDTVQNPGDQIYLNGNTNHQPEMKISFSCVQGGNNAPHVNGGNWLIWGPGMIQDDPLFVSGPEGDYYLSQIFNGGQTVKSLCVDKGDPASAIFDGTTRTDHVQDAAPIDMGYHYPLLTFHLNVEPAILYGGGSGIFSVTDGKPNENTYLVYSLVGVWPESDGPNTYVPQLDVWLWLKKPLKLAGGVMKTDSDGDGHWIFTIPPSPGLDVWFQAVQYGQATNWVHRRIQ